MMLDYNDERTYILCMPYFDGTQTSPVLLPAKRLSNHPPNKPSEENKHGNNNR